MCCVCLCTCVWGLGSKEESYLCEIEDVCVRDCEQSIDGAAEGVDLLVGVSHEDLPTGLRQNDVHDGCSPEGASKRSDARPTHTAKGNQTEDSRGREHLHTGWQASFPAGHMHSVQGNNFHSCIYFWTCCEACEISVPDQGLNPRLLQWKCSVLTTNHPEVPKKQVYNRQFLILQVKIIFTPEHATVSKKS